MTRMRRTVLLAVGLAILFGASPAWAAHVGAPAKLRLGKIVVIRVSGFPPGSKIRLQLASQRARRYNCCVSLTYPATDKPGIAVGGNGSATVHWRVPSAYAQCVSSICANPEFKRFMSGESVAVDVSTEEDTAFAEARTRVT